MIDSRSRSLVDDTGVYLGAKNTRPPGIDSLCVVAGLSISAVAQLKLLNETPFGNGLKNGSQLKAFRLFSNTSTDRLLLLDWCCQAYIAHNRCRCLRLLMFSFISHSLRLVLCIFLKPASTGSLATCRRPVKQNLRLRNIRLR